MKINKPGGIVPIRTTMKLLSLMENALEKKEPSLKVSLSRLLRRQDKGTSLLLRLTLMPVAEI